MAPTDRIGRRLGLLYDDRMCRHKTPDGKSHPEKPGRTKAIWKKLQSSRIFERCVILAAEEAQDKSLFLVHDKGHVNLIKSVGPQASKAHRKRTAAKFDSIYLNEGSTESAYLAAGSVIKAAEKVASGDLSSAFAVVRPPGHHAEPDKPMGFCIFNNVAVAARYILDEKPELGINKILIVDWDVHHGNGTQKMFWKDQRVLVFSVHRHESGNFFPANDDGNYTMIGEDAGAGYNINVPWENDLCGDADYLAAWDHILIPVAKEFNPDMVMISAGFDAAMGDPLGGCCVTPNGYSAMLRKLMDFGQGKMVLALEGGYNLTSTANSALACMETLLGQGDGPTEASPSESTWRVIKAVRNELKTFWKALADELSTEVQKSDGSSPQESTEAPLIRRSTRKRVLPTDVIPCKDAAMKKRLKAAIRPPIASGSQREAVDAGSSGSPLPDVHEEVRRLILGESEVVTHRPTQVSTLEEDPEATEDFLRGFGGRLLTLGAEACQIGTEVANLKRTITSEKAAREKVEADKTALSKQIEALELDLSKERSSREAVEKALQQQVADLERKVASFQTKEVEEARLNKDLEDVRRELAAVSKAMEEKSTEVTTLRAAALENKKELTSRLGERDLALGLLQSELAQLKASSEDKVARLTVDVASLKDALAAAENRATEAGPQAVAKYKGSREFRMDALQSIWEALMVALGNMVQRVAELDPAFPVDKVPHFKVYLKLRARKEAMSVPAAAISTGLKLISPSIKKKWRWHRTSRKSD